MYNVSEFDCKKWLDLEDQEFQSMSVGKYTISDAKICLEPCSTYVFSGNWPDTAENICKVSSLYFTINFGKIFYM